MEVFFETISDSVPLVVFPIPPYEIHNWAKCHSWHWFFLKQRGNGSSCTLLSCLLSMCISSCGLLRPAQSASIPMTLHFSAQPFPKHALVDWPQEKKGDFLTAEWFILAKVWGRLFLFCFVLNGNLIRINFFSVGTAAFPYYWEWGPFARSLKISLPWWWSIMVQKWGHWQIFWPTFYSSCTIEAGR